MNSLIGIKKTNWYTKVYNTYIVSKQATKISEIRLHYLGYKNKTRWKKHTHTISIFS